MYTYIYTNIVMNRCAMHLYVLPLHSLALSPLDLYIYTQIHRCIHTNIHKYVYIYIYVIYIYVLALLPPYSMKEYFMYRTRTYSETLLYDRVFQYSTIGYFMCRARTYSETLLYDRVFQYPLVNYFMYSARCYSETLLYDRVFQYPTIGYFMCRARTYSETLLYDWSIYTLRLGIACIDHALILRPYSMIAYFNTLRDYFVYRARTYPETLLYEGIF